MKTKRIFVFVIDCLFSTVIGLGVPEALAGSFLTPLVLFCVYYILLEYFFGKTLGKFIMSIKVVNADNSNITLKTACLRHLGRFKHIFHLQKMFYHDVYSKTKVV